MNEEFDTFHMENQRIHLENERALFELITMGDVGQVSSFLRNHPNVDVNYLNFQGMCPLLIAVTRKNEEMVEFLLKLPGIEIRDAALFAIKENATEILLMILDHQKEINPNLEYSPAVDSSEFAEYVTPLMLAAEYGRFEMIGLLISRGHSIPRPHRPRCFCRSECLRHYEIEDSVKHTSARYHLYSALCNPTYICHTSEDPILTAFLLSQEVHEAGFVDMSFKESYNVLSKEVRLFAAELLAECRSEAEIEIILREDTGGKVGWGSVLYPRILVAMEFEQKEFVAQTNLQTVLERTWIADWYMWKGYSKYYKLFLVFPRILMIPFIVFILICSPNSRLAQHYTSPVNKMLSSVASYIVFLLLIFIKSNMDKKYQKRASGPTGLEIVILIFIMSYVVDSAMAMCRDGWRASFRSSWIMHRVVMEMLFCLAFFFWGISYVTISLAGDSNLERKYWHYLDPALLGEGFFAIATIMAFLRLLLLLQLDYELGPFQVCLGRLVRDCYTFSILLSLIIISFTAGLCRFYSYYTDMRQVNPDTGTDTLQEASWVTASDTARTLFWGLFGMSSYSVADVIIENLPDEEGHLTLINQHSFTEAIGYLMFAVYMILTVIVLLNMLIATMSNSFQLVTENVREEWVFGRTEIFIQYMNKPGMPPPFYILPVRYGIFSQNFLRILGSKSHYKDAEKDYGYRRDKERAEFISLMGQLVQRYFRRKRNH